MRVGPLPHHSCRRGRPVLVVPGRDRGRAVRRLRVRALVALVAVARRALERRDDGTAVQSGVAPLGAGQALRRERLCFGHHARVGGGEGPDQQFAEAVREGTRVFVRQLRLPERRCGCRVFGPRPALHIPLA